jgi:nicotinamidase-related amidase
MTSPELSPQAPDIPRAPEVRLKAAECAVIVVDMQNDFAHPDGALFVPDAPATVPAIRGLLDGARRAGARVVYTQDWHPEDDPEFAIWPRHAVEESWGARILDALAPRPGETVIRKARYDGFYGTPLEHLLHLWGVRHLVIVGTVANICVLHTAGSAALRWYRVVVPEDAVSALTPFDHLAALRQVAFLYQGVITAAAGVRFGE